MLSFLHVEEIADVNAIFFHQCKDRCDIYTLMNQVIHVRTRSLQQKKHLWYKTLITNSKAMFTLLARHHKPLPTPYKSIRLNHNNIDKTLTSVDTWPKVPMTKHVISNQQSWFDTTDRHLPRQQNISWNTSLNRHYSKIDKTTNIVPSPNLTPLPWILNSPSKVSFFFQK